MARKTREERRIEEMGRRNTYRREAYDSNKNSWIPRLMKAMECAENIFVNDGNFQVYITETFEDHYNTSFNETHKFIFSPVLMEETVSEQLYKLEEFERIVEKNLEKIREQERIDKIKTEALSKLTIEERKALGL